MKPTIKNTMIAVFSYNRPRELSGLLDSIIALCGGMRVIVFDDQSENQAVYSSTESRHIKMIRREKSIKGRHGGLYLNMQSAYEFAMENKFDFLFMIQDDMQFVRSFNQNIAKEYGKIFGASKYITQIDPRFVRGNGSDVVSCEGFPAFEWLEPYRQTYSDVGLFSVERLKALEWHFVEGEKNNREAARNLGMRRVYPFSPIAMHIPFPTVFRQRKSNFFSALNDGGCSYCTFNETACNLMDDRNPTEPPLFRKYLKLNRARMLDRLRFAMLSDKRVFR